MTKIILNVLKQTSGVFSIATLLIANSALANQVSVEQLANAQDVNTNTTNYPTTSSELPTESQGNTSSEEVQIPGDTRLQNLKDPSLKIPGAELEQVDPMGQVTSVTQLSDVQPTDWAFQALQSLVERYGCIAGYPDGTYKGNRAMTRYEFAAGLNACLDRITELVAAATADLVTRDDLAVLQRLQEEFATELAELRGRVDALEARTEELEANQFSTTTKLGGETLFWLSDTFGEKAGGRGLPRSDEDRTEATLSYRVRLIFDTSFTGKDRLRTRLQARNVPNYSDRDLTNSLMTRLSTDDDLDDDVTLNKLAYRFPLLNNKAQIEIAANGYGIDDFVAPINPFQSSGSGSVSRFGRFTPTYYRAPSDAGMKFAYAFSDAIKATIGYAVPDSEDPQEGRGLFNGGFSGFGQFTIEPNDKIAFQIGYLRAYHTKGDLNLTGSTGSFLARDPFDDQASTADNINFEAQWKVNDWFQIGGWFGTSFARPEDDSDDDDITILTGALTLAFPDLFREGSLGGIIVGVPPIITDGGDDDDLKDPDTSIHIEVFYRFQMTDNIAITPGLFVITNPNHIEDNETLWVGSIRTQFRF
ncbi:MAG: iron uptake porin [Okeania sp. SIO3H1]|uniref:iron uptake porin n=1 Tax=Okeania sp. SIO1I7 TaxID=2607772 RepID=UPI0013C75015|nr:iron uptake porin [Okeania sp. SIO1I7]NEN91167.1 iron uptake porin [Okeania sp. SIO3H1]NET24293.1 iron uptake porin [Okeania sp. SIO1I7]